MNVAKQLKKLLRQVGWERKKEGADEQRTSEVKYSKPDRKEGIINPKVGREGSTVAIKEGLQQN